MRYIGEFVNAENEQWKVEIFHDGDAATPAKELALADDDTLTIEWTETSKEDVVCGSTATVRVISPGDRSFTDLYTIEAGAICINIYRKEVLYWQGTLDPEFYEEPYSEMADYEVELTFSDFGILDRLKYNLNGMQTIAAILRDALTRAKITGIVNETLISTQLTADAGRMKLQDMSIRSENFTDEDGEHSTLKEALDGLLQPLGLRMIQRAGQVWVYDLNGLYERGRTQKIRWHDDDQVLGVDKVANNVKITFSPYAKALLTQEAVYTGTGDIDAEQQDGDPDVKFILNATTYPKQALFDKDNIGFKIFASKKGRGLAWVSDNVRYFKTIPVFGNEESQGVAYGYKPITGWFGGSNNGHPVYKFVLNDPAQTWKDRQELMRTHRVFIGKTADADRYRLRITLEMLTDVRCNPAEDADMENEKGDYESAQAAWAMVYIESKVRILDDGGNLLAAYDNTGVDYTAGPIGMAMSGQGWKTGTEAENAVCRLGYYDPEDLRDGCGICGWKKNRHYIGMGSGKTWHELRTSFRKIEDGQYLPYPPVSGWLEITVMAGLTAVDYWHKRPHRHNYMPVDKSEYDLLRWMLYKAPQAEIVRSTMTMAAAESDDIEYKGVLNRAAKDSIDIDTTCGTMRSPLPTAKGVYLNASTGDQIRTLHRAGRTGLAERLLIGTLYSQFAGRKDKLTGTADLLTDGLTVMTEGAAPGKRFVLLGDVQHIGEGTSEATIVELRPDEYDGIDEK